MPLSVPIVLVPPSRKTEPVMGVPSPASVPALITAPLACEKPAESNSSVAALKGRPSVPAEDALPKSITVLAVSGAISIVPLQARNVFDPARVMSSLASASVGVPAVAEMPMPLASAMVGAASADGAVSCFDREPAREHCVPQRDFRLSEMNYRILTLTISSRAGPKTCAAQAMQGSKLWIVRSTSRG